MQVSFNDVPGGVATLQTTYTNCTNTTANGQSQLLPVYIRSITGVALGAITLNSSPSGSLPFCSTAPVTLEVPLLTIPRHANDPDKNATVSAQSYEWTIPAGWLWPDGTTSTGASRLFSSPAVSVPNRVVVTPPVSGPARMS